MLTQDYRLLRVSKRVAARDAELPSYCVLGVITPRSRLGRLRQRPAILNLP